MPKRMDTAPQCATCDHWDQRFPENVDLGVCRRMGAIVFGKKLSLLATSNPEPTSDFEYVRTRRFFGCVMHSDFVQMQMAGTL